MKRIFALNLGSTSTKVAYYEDDECIFADSIRHPAEQTAGFATVFDQTEWRKRVVLDYMQDNCIDIDSLDAIVSRGGQTEPIPGGVWRINEAMLEQVESGAFGVHVCSVGCRIAYDLCEGRKAIPLTVDTPTTDEMDPLARYSGLKEISRASCVQALNVKAMSRYYAQQHGRSFGDVRLVTVMLGGGIGVVGIRDGRMVDAPDGLEGEGPFSNNRAGTLPVGQVVKMCFDSGRTREQMLRHINGEAGLMSYLGTTDLREIMARIDAGDAQAREVVEAMCYQTSKEVGAMATVLEGKVDAILLIGGMANVDFICDEIKRRCAWIAPVEVMPGEREMERLAEGALEVLTGIDEIHEFIPSTRR